MLTHTGARFERARERRARLERPVDAERLAGARDTARLSVVIRRHRIRKVSLDDLVAWGTISPTLAGFLAAFTGMYFTVVLSTDELYRTEFAEDVAPQIRETFAVHRAYVHRLQAEADTR